MLSYFKHQRSPTAKNNKSRRGLNISHRTLVSHIRDFFISVTSLEQIGAHTHLTIIGSSNSTRSFVTFLKLKDLVFPCKRKSYYSPHLRPTFPVSTCIYISINYYHFSATVMLMLGQCVYNTGSYQKDILPTISD